MKTSTQQTTADVDPPLVPDQYLKRLKALPIGLLIGALWSLASKASSHEDAADVIADEIKAIREYEAWVAADREVDELLAAA